MKESDHEDQHAPLSYRGAWRIVWLVFLLIIFWLIVRSLEPVILLFALVFLLAMVLNPIVVWLEKRHLPRFVSVILLILALIAITATIQGKLAELPEQSGTSCYDRHLVWSAAWPVLCSQFCCWFLSWLTRARS